MRTFFGVVTTLITVIWLSLTLTATATWWVMTNPKTYLDSFHYTNAYQRAINLIPQPANMEQLPRIFTASWLENQMTIVIPTVLHVIVTPGLRIHSFTSTISLQEPKTNLFNILPADQRPDWLNQIPDQVSVPQLAEIISQQNGQTPSAVLDQWQEQVTAIQTVMRGWQQALLIGWIGTVVLLVLMLLCWRGWRRKLSAQAWLWGAVTVGLSTSAVAAWWGPVIIAGVINGLAPIPPEGFSLINDIISQILHQLTWLLIWFIAGSIVLLLATGISSRFIRIARPSRQ